jgi:hypothetical protein
MKITLKKKKPNGYWTKEKCHEEAVKFTYRHEFEKNSKSAYSIAIKNKWIDDICSHMEVIGNLKKRCIYAIEFADNHAYIGLTFNLKKRFSEHTTGNKKTSVYKHIEKTGNKPIIKQLTDYIDVGQASSLEGIKEKEYIDNGWIMLNKVKCGTIGGNCPIWTKEKCAEEAKKYSSKHEFKKANCSAYGSCLKNKWIDEVCSHMIPKNKIHGFWNIKENCLTEALKYDNRSDFNKGSFSAYNGATKNGWLEEICSHMKVFSKPANFWTKENCLKESLKYKSRGEFAKNSISAYTISRKNKWLNYICEHMNKLKNNE